MEVFRYLNRSDSGERAGCRGICIIKERGLKGLSLLYIGIKLFVAQLGLHYIIDLVDVTRAHGKDKVAGLIKTIHQCTVKFIEEFATRFFGPAW